MQRMIYPATIAAVLMLLGGSTMLIAGEGETMMKTVSKHYTIPVALAGYSPVSYIEHHAAEPGSAEFAAEHDGVTYFFTSNEQLSAFKADPDMYLPAYGGWCAFGMAVEDHFPINPHSFKIVDGRLMLFLHNDEVNALDLWNEDEAGSKQKADAFWNETHGS